MEEKLQRCEIKQKKDYVISHYGRKTTALWDTAEKNL
jgi:hypothetical protein